MFYKFSEWKNKLLYNSVIIFINNFFVAKYLRCEAPILDYPELLSFFSSFISHIISSSLNWVGAGFDVIYLVCSKFKFMLGFNAYGNLSLYIFYYYSKLQITFYYYLFYYSINLNVLADPNLWK
jgi:hypothetical protein